jgi:hypothetical protein
MPDGSQVKKVARLAHSIKLSQKRLKMLKKD